MIQRIYYLLDKQNIKANKLITDLNLPNSSLSEWKRGKSKPGVDAIIKIANYFEVSIDWLLTGVDVIPKLQPNCAQIQSEFIKLYKSLPYGEKMKIIGKLELMAEEDKNDITETKGKLSDSKTG